MKKWLVECWVIFVAWTVPSLLFMIIWMEWKYDITGLDTILFLILYLVCLLWGYGHHRAERWAKVQNEEEN